MTLIVTLSDHSRPRVELYTLPGYDTELAIEDAVSEIELDTGLVALDWELA